MPTCKGHSGSPIVVDNQIIGIHAGSAVPQTFNVGVLLTDQIINKLKRWCIQLNGDQFKVNQQKCPLHPKMEAKKQIKNYYIPKGMAIPPVKLIQPKPRLRNLSISKNDPSVNSTSLNKDLKQNIKNIDNSYDKKANSTQKLPYNYGNTKILTKPKQQIINNYPGYQYKNTIQANALLQWNAINQNTLQRAKNVFEMGKKKHEQKNYQEALQNFKWYLQTQQKIKGKGCFQSAITYIWLGSSHYNLNNHSQAISNYQQSISIYQNRNKTNMIEYAIALGNLANIYEINYIYDIAINIYDKARETYEAIGDKASVERYSQMIINCMKKQRKKIIPQNHG